MTNPARQGNPDIEKSVQELVNKSFDREFNVLAVEPVVYDGTSLVRQAPGAAGLVTSSYDYVSRTLSDPVTETYVYKTGGSGGTTVATVTVVYTASDLATISSVTRT